jgi:hypothetical protein
VTRDRRSRATPRSVTGLGSAARKGCLLLLVSVTFLPFGVPRWLDHAAAPVSAHAGDTFLTLCRDHGGTPRTTPAPGRNAKARSFCTVRYGRHDYVMDAITRAGFDTDTARYQRQGCDEARRAEEDANAARRRGRSFIYHPATGVCERRS